jgi:prepilin-type N-terminal cleavage/methylation domain-containing protein
MLCTARLDIPGVLHHVIVRGIERSPIFVDIYRNDAVHSELVAHLVKNVEGVILMGRIVNNNAETCVMALKLHVTTQEDNAMSARKPVQSGFTLIELLIVVAIIGILAAIAIPQFSAYRAKAYNSAATSDLKNLKTSLETYYTDHQFYPY